MTCKGSLGAPTIQVGGKPTEEIGVRKLDDDELSQLSDWEKGALIEHIKKMQLSVGSKGSRPNRDSKPSAAENSSKRMQRRKLLKFTPVRLRVQSPAQVGLVALLGQRPPRRHLQHLVLVEVRMTRRRQRVNNSTGPAFSSCGEVKACVK